jgi:hypothetical protein
MQITVDNCEIYDEDLHRVVVTLSSCSVLAPVLFSFLFLFWQPNLFLRRQN